MLAFTKSIYGGPEVLQLNEVEKPSVKDGEILVKVFANSANPADWHILRGEPILARFAFGMFKPKYKILGADFAGVVEAVGPNVEGFKVGARVFGETLRGGAFAEYTCVGANFCAPMPEGATFSEMAGLPIAGLTALQALTTHGNVKDGESVLVNGASGGVGHLVVQIAKAYGANVTGVCSSKNIDFVKKLGADNVIPYNKKNIHEHQGKYDLIIDTHGNLTFSDFKRMGKRGIVVGFTTMAQMISVSLQGKLSSFPLIQFTAAANTKDMERLASLVEQRKIKVWIEKTYPYQEIPEAIRYIEAMRTRGKVVMVWDNENGR
jgi:NADPH:quinone reductase-like Zn-dependent oxidoreductase